MPTIAHQFVRDYGQLIDNVMINVLIMKLRTTVTGGIA